MPGVFDFTSNPLLCYKPAMQKFNLKRIKGALAGLLFLAAVFVAAQNGNTGVPGQTSSTIDDPAPLQYLILITERGQSLCDIAADQELYGTSLMWPQIYYYNTDEIAISAPKAKYDPFSPLPPGMNLAVIPASNAAMRAKIMAAKKPSPWIINVKSSDKSMELSKLAVDLMDKGHFCYIAKFSTQNKVWKRLRVGFFPTLEEANIAREKIYKEFGLEDAWATKASPEEAIKFMGFLDSEME